ncbi:GtrA family protein [Thiomicrospira cyclica]|uniref:GtrA family protein n=1 Tax=Thiomicrospira cyclica (strain DSM 14477 / JCM 11371 / ALM1) TaxID=717773 RepID=F6DA48_THICA|nr:GtrA family protein [Thiomicrospira cyclica]AEG32179.1 GtrA family protein [Thiomicrospira cyclica ALM1]
MAKKFSRYTLIGLLNTAVHWIVFALVVSLGFSQAIANGLGFLTAVTGSYLLNSKITFNKAPNKKGYSYFVIGMGSISVLIGALGDYLEWPGLVTLVVFSFTSLLLGFGWSKWVVFK